MKLFRLVMVCAIASTACGTSPVSNASTAESAVSSESAGPRRLSGQTGVKFFNGQNVSESAFVSLPERCELAEFRVLPIDTSIACCNPNSQQTLGVCPSSGGASTSQVLTPSFRQVSEDTVEIFEEAADGVCVNILGSLPLGSECGAISKQYQVAWEAACAGRFDRFEDTDDSN
jgi:hypothetical protein